MRFVAPKVLTIRFRSTVAVLVGLVLFATISIQAQTHDERLKAQELINAGNAHLLRGDSEQAVQKFSQVVILLPNLAIGYINRGLALVALNRLSEALEDADKAVELSKSAPDAKYFLAMAFQLKGHAFKAKNENQTSVEEFTKAIELEPNNPRFLHGRGTSYLFMGKLDQALNDFNKAIELDPSIFQSLLNRAIIHRRNKNYEASLRDLDSVLKLDPTNASAFNNRGNIQKDQKLWSDAILSFSSAISIDPKSEYFYNRAKVHHDKGDFTNAISDNSEAIKRDRNNDKAYYNRGIAYNRLGKNDLALDDLRRAMQINDKSSARRYNYGFLLFQVGRFAEARNEMTTLILRHPKWKAAHVLRGEAAARMGDAASAKKDREIASGLSEAWKPDEEEFLIFDFTFAIRGQEIK